MKVKSINNNILLELKQQKPDLYNKCKQKFPELDNWTAGDDFPTYKQLVKLSKIFKIPFGYFFLQNLPKYVPVKSIFISGAISNDPNYIQKFEYWKKILNYNFPKAKIKCPTDFIPSNNVSDKKMWADAIIKCLKTLKNCTHIFLIPENTQSVGKNIETLFAKQLEIEFIPIETIDLQIEKN